MKIFSVTLCYSVLLCNTLYCSLLLCTLFTILDYPVLLCIFLIFSITTWLLCQFFSTPRVVSAWSGRGRAWSKTILWGMADLSVVDIKKYIREEAPRTLQILNWQGHSSNWASWTSSCQHKFLNWQGNSHIYIYIYVYQSCQHKFLNSSNYTSSCRQKSLN